MGKRAELRAVWSKREQDIVYHFDKRPEDGHFLASLMTEGARRTVSENESEYVSWTETLKRLRATLVARGYDPDTLTISVRRKR